MYASSSTPVVRGKLSATTADGSADCSCQPTPAAGYRGLENQLYRIEIHQKGSEATATFKWSRENGSIVVAVLGVAGSNVQVDSLGPDANLGFSTGQWVEITDDSYLFGQPPNQPGDLYQIQLITPEQLNITMTQPVSQVDKTKNARLRRWDQFGSSAGSTGVPLSAGTWLELENGIQVQFTTGQYQSGDSWVIPARTASGQIDWPPCESDGSQFQPGHRTEIFRAPLACIHWNSTSQSAVVEDCRRSFPPLTDLTSNVLSAIHVTQISWFNDDVMTLDQLVVNGLTVSLDQAVTGDVDGGNFIVSLEIPEIPSGAGQLAPVKWVAATTVLRGVSTLDGPISASKNPASILWQLPEGVFRTPSTINQLLLPGAQYGLFGRVRVKLVGHALFATTSAGQIFLDGQSFGTPAVRSDGSTPRIDLQLPSGNAQKASDFESWFYLGPILAVVEVSIEHPNLVITGQSSTDGWPVADAGTTGPPVTQQGTVTLNYPPTTPTTINLSIMSSTSTDVSPYVSVPANVTVPANQTTSNTFTVSVIGNPQAMTVSYSVVASLPLASGTSNAQSQQLSLAGFQPAQ